MVKYPVKIYMFYISNNKYFYARLFLLYLCLYSLKINYLFTNINYNVLKGLKQKLFNKNFVY